MSVVQLFTPEEALIPNYDVTIGLYQEINTIAQKSVTMKTKRQSGEGTALMATMIALIICYVCLIISASQTMDIKDGIIINGEFHKKETVNNIACSQCSLKSYCDIVDNNYDVWLCTIHNCLGFICQGTVTELKVEEKQ